MDSFGFTDDEIVAWIRTLAEENGWNDGCDDNLNDEYVKSGECEIDMIQSCLNGFSDAPNLDDIRGMVEHIESSINTYIAVRGI